ncbi:glutamate dehydrogenase [Polaribacter sp. ALD11]|uniref:LysE family transporter n=1 Tax=Polaribacter sp. ALD11 TaxID=2058137 RepID=UPI000C3014B1|nr:LysE family transporter [Polaribacter sp. ALD11]AUC85791.1 glutamate dehydrogenase [Polaribacter sp. ALD11]
MLFLTFFIGFILSSIGSIPPSMLNMTSLKISLEKGRKASNKYALGVSIIAIPQVFIAVILTKHIAENPAILGVLEKAGILIFILLSYYFYSASRKGKIKVEEIKKKKEFPFLTGITLSVINMFGIPFFCGIVVLLDALRLFSFHMVSVLFFTLGSVLGTFYVLFLYGKFAKKIQQKTGKLTKDINIVLSILTGFVAVITLIKGFI